MRAPLWMVAWLLIAELFVIMVFVPGSWTESVVEREQELIRSSLGQNTVEWINEKALSWYTSSMLDSGVCRTLHEMTIPTPEERARSVGMQDLGATVFPWVEDRLAALMHVVYQVCLRIAMIMVWAPYMLILFIPAVFDGVMTWKIKRTNFDYASPVMHRYGLRGVLLTVQLMLIAFFAPIALNPIIIPAALMVSCVMIGLIVANVQKRL